MITSNQNNSLKVQAIAGTYVVILAFDLPEDDCEGLLGFSILRDDHEDGESYYLKGMKAFAETDPGFPAGSLYSTKDHPIQSFQWADYSAKPGHRYTYTVTALKGKPTDLMKFEATSVDVNTESPVDSKHEVYFNNGVAASQEYVRRFGDKPPSQVPNNKAFEWLSRGVYEALEEFVNSCVPGTHSLRIAAYEFHYDKFLQLLRKAIDRSVDIKILYHARKRNTEDYVRDRNREKVLQYGLGNYCIERANGNSYISHNKFIVKLENSEPVSVWTGGMNFSEGGIFGQSNVAHVVKEKSVAEKYLEYWEVLSKDLTRSDTQTEIDSINSLPSLPLSMETTCVFSPRRSDTLKMYQDLAKSAKSGFFMTFAFGMNDTFKEVYQSTEIPIRYALLERAVGSWLDGQERQEEELKIQQLRNLPENVFAVGNFIRTNNIDGWVQERLSGLNTHVRYIHNKFMLIDPLGEDPIVITGSANFSNASTFRNDENMVIIKGDKNVAHIYLGEYMRIFSHHAFRESLKWRDLDDPPKPLKTDNWWLSYFGNTQRSNKRKYFVS